MSCDCDYSDGPDFYSERWQKARKSHTCNECQSVIEPGERYKVCAGKWDGDVRSYKICQFCSDVWGEINHEVDCICFGSLWEVAADYEPEIIKAGLL